MDLEDIEKPSVELQGSTVYQIVITDWLGTEDTKE